ncbi:hypothetical protein Hs30E_14970 [Lactococcus hodotermopsidis]|uniref:DUF2975 domain-containing protein n=1 Tax=Pseudolactococcus hodotermopsidis TaxID=2709157 RepID=A0A6A0BDR6_9LACT|nr:DUF2975 domain-containing protein [Lactococcus hodotermopsidis]GFH42946.1 hypothetical protein Hs30E_14970 [Lactococcus hodotermopsidis]
MKFEWSQKQSLRLTLAVTGLFFIGIIVTMLKMKYFVDLLLPLNGISQYNISYFYVTLYVALTVMLGILILLACLVRNIQKDIVFDPMNIRYLRLISWSCILVALILLLSAFYHFQWIILAVAATFMALIVRVVKNVFCQALLIKEENEFTI